MMKIEGEIPFKDQVLAINHDFMLNLVKGVIGNSQFEVPNLNPSSTVICSENLNLIKLENVIRMYMAKSTTSTSLYQHWLKAKKNGEAILYYAGHALDVDSISPNSILPYVMDTPSTKDKEDKTIDSLYLFDNDICTPD